MSQTSYEELLEIKEGINNLVQVQTLIDDPLMRDHPDINKWEETSRELLLEIYQKRSPTTTPESLEKISTKELLSNAVQFIYSDIYRYLSRIVSKVDQIDHHIACLKENMNLPPSEKESLAMFLAKSRKTHFTREAASLLIDLEEYYRNENRSRIQKNLPPHTVKDSLLALVEYTTQGHDQEYTRVKDLLKGVEQ